MRHKVYAAGLETIIEVDSAGTGDWHVGETPHKGTRIILKQNSVDDSGIKARQVATEDFAKHDYIIAMDASNVENIIAFAPDEAGKAHVYRMLDFLPESAVRDVPDPYYTGNFDEVYRMVDASCDRLLAFIREKHLI